MSGVDQPRDFQTADPSPAGVYNYLLDGRDNTRPDRQAVNQVMQKEPGLAVIARQNAAFARRVVAHLAGLGFDQFVDVGSGLPVAEDLTSLPTAAWEVNPAARFVHLDNDPAVLVQVRARAPMDPRTSYLHADIRDLDTVLGSDQYRALDPGRPIAWLMFALLHFLHPADRPEELIDRIGARSSAGSVLALSHTSHENYDREGRRVIQGAMDEAAPGMVHLRTRAEIAQLVGDRRLLPPGLCDIIDWRPGDGDDLTRVKLMLFGGVAYL